MKPTLIRDPVAPAKHPGRGTIGSRVFRTSCRLDHVLPCRVPRDSNPHSPLPRYPLPTPPAKVAHLKTTAQSPRRGINEKSADSKPLPHGALCFRTKPSPREVASAGSPSLRVLGGGSNSPLSPPAPIGYELRTRLSRMCRITSCGNTKSKAHNSAEVTRGNKRSQSGRGSIDEPGFNTTRAI